MDYRTVIGSFLENFDLGGNFVVSGHLTNLSWIKVSVDGVGRLGWPVHEVLAQCLISKMEPVLLHNKEGDSSSSSFDPNPSSSHMWQLDPTHITTDDRWNQRILVDLLHNVCHQLGVDSQRLGVQAHLSKMILYEKGCPCDSPHVTSDDDEEKEELPAGIFGYLLIQLPSFYEGGVMSIQHGDETIPIPMEHESEDHIHWMAFFSDCNFWNRNDIVQGRRIVLLYRLVATTVMGETNPPTDEESGVGNSAHGLPSAYARRKAGQNLRNVFFQWSQDPSGPKKLAIVLEHKYTESNLSSLAVLQGKDKTLLNMLQAFKGEDGRTPLLDVYLCLREKYVRSYRDVDDAGNVIMGDIIESEENDVLWVGTRGRLNIDMHIDPYEILGSDDVFEDLDLDDPDQEEYDSDAEQNDTSIVYWYYKTLLVFCPKSKPLLPLKRQLSNDDENSKQSPEIIDLCED